MATSGCHLTHFMTFVVAELNPGMVQLQKTFLQGSSSPIQAGNKLRITVGSSCDWSPFASSSSLFTVRLAEG